MPATPPTVITVPIGPLVQPCASKNTPRNGPMPDCMSAMKKFSASNGQTLLEASLESPLGVSSDCSLEPSARKASSFDGGVNPKRSIATIGDASLTPGNRLGSRQWPLTGWQPVGSMPAAVAAGAARNQAPAEFRSAAAAARPAG